MKRKILLKLTEHEASWSALAYVFPINILVYFLNKKNKMILLHCIRGFLWYLCLFVPNIIIYFARINATGFLVNIFTILFIIDFFWTAMLLIDYFLYMMDCCKERYKTSFIIDKIFYKIIDKYIKKTP